MLTRFNFEPISFLIGFVAATLLWWLVAAARPLIEQARENARKRAEEAKSRTSSAGEESYRRIVFKRAQKMHIAASLFSLNETAQGSIVSMSYALTKPGRVAGVIAQSGYLPHESGLQVDEAGIRGKPFILTHGIHEPLLPVDWARRSRDTLQTLGADLEYHEFDMGHQVSEESLAVIHAWLTRQLQ